MKKRVLSALLVFCLAFSLVGTAWAADSEQATPETAQADVLSEEADAAEPTPDPTEEPAATATPDPTATPAPTEAPAATATPEPSDAPEATPAATAAPEAAEQAEAETAALPEAAAIPEGYTVQRTVRDEENGFAVTVYAPEGVIPADAVLCATLLDKVEHAEEYEKAEQELEESGLPVAAAEDTADAAALALTAETEDTESEEAEDAKPSYGFAALDIHLENAEGEEIEPSGDVYVSIDATALLPEDADPATVTVQHHEEQSNGEVTVEKVADAADETAGVVEVTAAETPAAETAETATADVQAAFEVGSFSTFTIRWNSNNQRQVTVHYVDTNGQGIQGPQTNELTPVETLDNNDYGIEMYLFNYATWNDESAVTNACGDDLPTGYNEGHGADQNLLKRKLGNNGYPVTSSGNHNLQKWFDINSADNSGVTSRQKVNHLFIQDVYDETGYFYYSSADNFATIKNVQEDNGEKDFNVYQELGTPQAADMVFYRRGNFLPFNTLNTNTPSQYNNKYDLEGNELAGGEGSRKGEPLYLMNEIVDFHFGMYMTADFLQPRDGKVNDEEMVFQFTGDDDMWVYIDDILVLDLGGAHDALSGSINFKTGVVTWQADNGGQNTNQTMTRTLRQLFIDAVGKPTFNREYAQYFNGNTFADYSQHTLKMFYMERGSGASNLRIKFNIPPVPSNSLMVEKNVSSETEAGLYLLGDYEYKFQIVGADGDVLIPEGTTYDIRTNSGATSVGTGTVGKDGIFTLKHGERAVFTTDKNGTPFAFLADNETTPYYVRELFEDGYSEQYGDIVYTISGQGGETGASEVETAPEGFDGFLSGQLTGNMGVGFVLFNNKIDANELSTLHVRKELMPGSHYTEGEKFKFTVSINGELLPVNSTYYMEGDTITQHTVTEAGKIELEPGQEAVIVGLVVGSTYTVSENASDYTITYAGEKRKGTTDDYTDIELTQITDDDGNVTAVSGSITETGSTHRVTVTNSDYDFYTSLPVNKTLNGYTTGSYDFEFTITEVTKSGDSYEPVETSTEGTTLVNASVTIDSAQPGTGMLYFGYDSSVETGTYYYKVAETQGSTTGVQYDTNYYIVHVTVSDSTGEKTATVGTIEKYNSEGVKQDYTGASADFVNSLSSKLTVTKTVDGAMGDTTKEFDFTLSLKLHDTNYSEDTLSGIKYAANDTQGTDVSVTKDSGTELYEFTLAHGEKIVLDVPYGYEATIAETIGEGYTVSTRTDAENETDAYDKNKQTVTVTTDADHKVDFKNFRDVVAPTGLETNHTKPYALMVGAGALAGLALVGGILARRARRRREW